MSINSLPNQILGEGLGGVAGLQGGGPQSLNGEHIGLPERDRVVRKVMLVAEILNQWRNLPEIAAWEARKEVVLHLKLQATVEPIHPGRAANIESAIGLYLKPIGASGGAKVDLGGEMVQAELNVLNSGNREANKNKESPLPPIGQEGD